MRRFLIEPEPKAEHRYVGHNTNPQKATKHSGEKIGGNQDNCFVYKTLGYVKLAQEKSNSREWSINSMVQILAILSSRKGCIRCPKYLVMILSSPDLSGSRYLSLFNADLALVLS